ncbi:MAG: hypothetical protein HXY49_00175 [Ignavibacteriaceae bacterium]|nr:hypothetical protein [Ignavibacteriaceae bacterium]
MKSEHSLKPIFYFWLPLAATWLMMSVEGPYLSALIARLPDPKFNLAAYGVAFSLALIIEAPVIMMMSAATTLVKDYTAFKQLRLFNYLLIASLTFLMLILILPPVFFFITENLIGLPSDVAELTHTAVIILVPWPGAIGFRRFYQGILIRNNATRFVAYGTIVRLVTMTLTALVLFLIKNVPGVVVGASALSAAVILEAAASRFMANKIILNLKSANESRGYLPLKDIFNFYIPLALTSLLTLGVQPFVTFLIGQSRMALESLAVLPVVTSFVFIFRGLGLSFQEVVVALLDEKEEKYRALKYFGIKLALTLTIILILIAFSPLAEIWFYDVSGLNETLTEFARLPLMIMSFFPALTVLISFQRGALVKFKSTKQITYGTAIEFAVIIITLSICIKSFNLVGAEAATISFVTGRIAACIYLMFPTVALLKDK